MRRPESVGADSFMRASTLGFGRYMAAMVAFTAAIGVFEALLYAWLGAIVDELSRVAPQRLWADQDPRLLTLAGALIGSIALVALQSLFKQQARSGNFPMRLRWTFHRLMLGQGMAFYGDEFAGRVAAKVMQTALAVRDVWMIVCDILVLIIIYFVTLVAVVGGFDPWMLAPLGGWLLLYLATLRFFVPRLARVAQHQADARPRQGAIGAPQPALAAIRRIRRRCGARAARRSARGPRDAVRRRTRQTAPWTSTGSLLPASELKVASELEGVWRHVSQSSCLAGALRATHATRREFAEPSQRDGPWLLRPCHPQL